jgi:hypothetical protein
VVRRREGDDDDDDDKDEKRGIDSSRGAAASAVSRLFKKNTLSLRKNKWVSAPSPCKIPAISTPM